MPPVRAKMILASASPRRRELLAAAGYEFVVQPPHESAECGWRTGETSADLVVRLARQKAADVAARCGSGLVIGCDTVVECCGQILGKPRDRSHARQMLELLRGHEHGVYSGLCLWGVPGDRHDVRVAVTRLIMNSISDGQLAAYLDSGDWEGKAGAFGYQDGHDWLQVIEGSESNVVGLPLELLDEMLTEWQRETDLG
ncbi:MAG: Maf family protein [Pirellulaceae bacterium]|nr:Maf family protein [Pirellulaceae bacterium]